MLYFLDPLPEHITMALFFKFLVHSHNPEIKHYMFYRVKVYLGVSLYSFFSLPS